MPHNNYFKFKQFIIEQNHSAMRVGTDGVMLGAWAPVQGTMRILDIGTGTGVIALMLAQRGPAAIDAVEINAGAVLDATHNFAHSPWNERLNLYHSSIDEFTANTCQKYDLIVCNPPYFSNSLKPASNAKLQARHSESLTATMLLKCVSGLLNSNGRFCVVLPSDNERQFRNEASTYRLFAKNTTRVRHQLARPFKRVLIEFSFESELCCETELTVETGNRHEYTLEFVQLVKDFYTFNFSNREDAFL